MLCGLSASVRATAAELFIAAPSAHQDLYAMHQRVWDRVSTAQAVKHAPTVLYRQDKGLVRVRVSDCAVYGGQFVAAGFCKDEIRSLNVRMVLSRDGKTMDRDLARRRVRELIDRGGMDLLEMNFCCWRASGHKRDMFIELGIADVAAKVRIRQPNAVAHAWRHGIGRGKRFGFGMMVFKT